MWLDRQSPRYGHMRFGVLPPAQLACGRSAQALGRISPEREKRQPDGQERGRDGRMARLWIRPKPALFSCRLQPSLPRWMADQSAVEQMSYWWAKRRLVGKRQKGVDSAESGPFWLPASAKMSPVDDRCADCRTNVLLVGKAPLGGQTAKRRGFGRIRPFLAAGFSQNVPGG